MGKGLLLSFAEGNRALLAALGTVAHPRDAWGPPGLHPQKHYLISIDHCLSEIQVTLSGALACFNSVLRSTIRGFQFGSVGS